MSEVLLKVEDKDGKRHLLPLNNVQQISEEENLVYIRVGSMNKSITTERTKIKAVDPFDEFKGEELAED